MFMVPQCLSRGRHRNDLLNLACRGTIQTVKRHEKRSPSLSAKDTGKGWGAFLTTEPTTHRPGPHGSSMVKETQRWSEAERKQPKTTGNARKKFRVLVRIRKVVGSIPIRPTRKSREIISFTAFLQLFRKNGGPVAQLFLPYFLYQPTLR